MTEEDVRDELGRDREQQWLEELQPDHLVSGSHHKRTVSKRKTRLCAAACCRQIWQRLPDVPCRQAVEVAERFADRRASPKQLADAQSSLAPGCKVTRGLLAALRELTDKNVSLWRFISDLQRWAEQQAFQKLGVNSPWRQNWNGHLCCLIRDVIGNPYRPVAVHSSWLSSDVTAIAKAIYSDRRFEDMPILADALEEAGCLDPAILEHCREPGPHARGCWLVDLILGRK